MKSSVSILALISALSPVAFARPRPQEAVTVTITFSYNEPAATIAPMPYALPAPMSYDLPAPVPHALAVPMSYALPEPPPEPVVMPISGTQYSIPSKRGLAYNSSSPALDIFIGYPKVNWGHCWALVDFSMPPSLEFVPTLADLTPDSLPFIEAHVQTARSHGSRYLMFLNEPDQPGSKAYMDVGSTVASYQQYMKKYAQSGFKLGSPSVTNGVINGMGLTYLTNFLDACQGCIIDFVPVHWYGCGDNCAIAHDVQMFKDQITAAMAAAQGKPIWIPEFQRLGSLDDQKAFLEQVLPWLDDPAQAQIERYAYFMVFDGFLLSDGQLNQVGLTYVS